MGGGLVATHASGRSVRGDRGDRGRSPQPGLTTRPAEVVATAGARPEKPGRRAPAGKKSRLDSGTTRAPPASGTADLGGPAFKTDAYDE